MRAEPASSLITIMMKAFRFSLKITRGLDPKEVIPHIYRGERSFKGRTDPKQK